MSEQHEKTVEMWSAKFDPTACRVELATAVDMVRLCRLLYGADAARELWLELGLPEIRAFNVPASMLGEGEE